MCAHAQRSICVNLLVSTSPGEVHQAQAQKSRIDCDHTVDMID